jgi:ABC-type glycerol-3-phosphate transport system substrate-binding protein
MGSPRFTRRAILRSLLAATGAVAAPALAACGGAPPATPQVVEKIVEKPVEKVVTQVVEKQVQVTQVVVVTATPAPAGPAQLEFIYSGADDVSSPNGKWLVEQVDAFQTANPTIKVKRTEMPWVGQREVVITRLVAGDAPDLAILHSNHAAEIGAGMGGLAVMDDITDFRAYSQIFVPGRLETVKAGGKHYGVPWFGIVFGVAAHKPTFAEVGVELPKTWTEFREAARKATVPAKRYGWGAAMGQGLDSAYRVYPFVLMNGARFMTDDLKTFTFNDQGNQEALQLFVDMKKDGSCAPGMEAWTGQNENDAFPTGLLAMAIGGPWMPLWEKDLAKLNTWELIPLPKPDKVAGAAPSLTLSDDIMLAMMRQSKAKAETFKLIQALQNEKNATERAVRPELIALPVVKAAFQDPRWKQVWGNKAYEQMLDASAPWPYSTVLGEAQNLYSLAVSKAYSGQASVKQALDEGVQKAQALIKG